MRGSPCPPPPLHACSAYVGPTNGQPNFLARLGIGQGGQETHRRGQNCTHRPSHHPASHGPSVGSMGRSAKLHVVTGSAPQFGKPFLALCRAGTPECKPFAAQQ